MPMLGVYKALLSDKLSAALQICRKARCLLDIVLRIGRQEA